ncbi:unnamed protein product [Ectocarpus sp. CCAP 1310/34]|nr:unnamed protein product [Ectocarpus sp. CCAP 1310/34]
MDAQAVAMFSTLTKGQHVTLREPHEQPPPVIDAPTSDISVADPPEVLAAHATAAALDEASRLAVEAAAARQQVEKDKAAALECKAEYERLQALAGPFFSMRRARNPG